VTIRFLLDLAVVSACDIIARIEKYKIVLLRDRLYKTCPGTPKASMLVESTSPASRLSISDT
jgi:hypothetical protein